MVTIKISLMNIIVMVKLQLVLVDDQLSLRGESLRCTIDKDKAKVEDKYKLEEYHCDSKTGSG